MDLFAQINEAALVGAAVDDVFDQRASAQRAADRQRMVHLDGFFRMQHLLPFEAVSRVAHPEPRVGDDHRHAGETFQPLFVDILQMSGISRFRAEAQ